MATAEDAHTTHRVSEIALRNRILEMGETQQLADDERLPLRRHRERQISGLRRVRDPRLGRDVAIKVIGAAVQ
jgi:hypothetical protein